MIYHRLSNFFMAANNIEAVNDWVLRILNWSWLISRQYPSTITDFLDTIHLSVLYLKQNFRPQIIIILDWAQSIEIISIWRNNETRETELKQDEQISETVFAVSIREENFYTKRVRQNHECIFQARVSSLLPCFTLACSWSAYGSGHLVEYSGMHTLELSPRRTGRMRFAFMYFPVA